MAEAAVTEESATQEKEGELGGPRFNPPLYRQRYEFVVSACKRLKPARVVDMGCAECKLLRLLRREESVRELVGVDMQASLLEAHQKHLQPLISDFVLRRSAPLTIRLMQGSIAEADQRLADYDLMACVEVIEHLDPAVLEQVPATVFGEIQPKVVIITTPNSEFNILFPDLHGFRHPDHRFEWTRAQFKDWCERVCELFPDYSVEFNGVGWEFLSKKHIGCPYTTVMECEYPYQKPLSMTERLRHEAEYRLLQLLKWSEREGEGEESEMRVKLSSLLQYQNIRQLCTDVQEIKEVLSDSAVVEKIEGEEVILDLSYGHSDSSLKEFEDEQESVGTAGVECEPEKWDSIY